MKLLITGAGSYIGTTFENWLREQEKEVHVDTLDMRQENWQSNSFAGYDTVFHVAGIAHADTGHASEETKALYYQVNTKLAIETAKKAKTDGAGQFVFMSSIIVYGDSAGIGKRKMITPDTVPAPANFYGDSKLQAEKGILALADEHFKVVILRPPMIYGRGAKGNFPLLVKFAAKLPVFPKIENERSMLYVGNLCCFLWEVMERKAEGIFFPQNEQYVATTEMVRTIADRLDKRLVFTRLCNPLLRLLGSLPGKPGKLVNKAFGSLTYEKGMSCLSWHYNQYNLKDSIQDSL
ncbi:MAG: NAD-dependent epimerase/dehydratase family protein [Lachnospiraceae bacterium]